MMRDRNKTFTKKKNISDYIAAAFNIMQDPYVSEYKMFIFTNDCHHEFQNINKTYDMIYTIYILISPDSLIKC